MNRYETYQQVVALPSHHLRWNLYGVGLENLGRHGTPEPFPLPQPGDHQLLVRIDAVGICFSDLKILRLGDAHPKIARDLRQHPVVMGHEIACTVAQVGAALHDRFRVGERYLVQADVYVGGKVQAVGYALEGGYTQYALMTEAVLDGDAGCYLVPCPSHLSYAEGALVEPWACIVASYQIAPRPTPKPNANWLVVVPSAPYIRYTCKALETLKPSEGGGGTCLILYENPEHPLVSEIRTHAQRLGMTVHTLACSADALYRTETTEALLQHAEVSALDDILLYGTPTPELLEWAIDHLAYGGHLSFCCHHPMKPVAVDVGRLHYDRLMVMGTSSWNITDAYHATRSTELREGERILLFGAGGPMGQMQLHYTLSRPQPPAQVVVVDRHPERLEPLRRIGTALAHERGIDLQLYCNADTEPAVQTEQLRQLCPHGFDQIMLLASSADAVAQTYPLLTDGGILNLFAGIPKGTKVPLDLTPTASRHMRVVGSSGSTLEDMNRCVAMTASGELPTRRVVSAVVGLNHLPEAFRAVAEHRYLGKVIVYPHLPTMPLMGLSELERFAPSAAHHLESGHYWTREAEAELFEQFYTSER